MTNQYLEEKFHQKVKEVIQHQLADGTMVSFWYGEAVKKEAILDGIRKILSQHIPLEEKIDDIDSLIKCIPKGITVGKLI